MGEGQIIGKLQTNKGEIIIRYPKVIDLNEIFLFDNSVRKETKFLDIIKQIPKKDEIKWFNDILDGIQKRNYVYLLAEHEGSIIGACTVRRQKEETYHHVGIYDIVVKKEYWGEGIGNLLTKLILKQAKNKLKLKIIRLILYSGNTPAQKLYEKYGFRVAGKIPKGVLHGRKYMDEIIYYKFL